MYSDRHGPRPSEQDRSEAVTGNVPWTDLYIDDVLARMRAQRLLSAKVKELRSLADSEFIGSAIDTTSNSVTVYWHGPRPAAVNTVVRQALASGITVNTVAAPFSGHPPADSDEHVPAIAALYGPPSRQRPTSATSHATRKPGHGDPARVRGDHDG